MDFEEFPAESTLSDVVETLKEMRLFSAATAFAMYAFGISPTDVEFKNTVSPSQVSEIEKLLDKNFLSYEFMAGEKTYKKVQTQEEKDEIEADKMLRLEMEDERLIRIMQEAYISTAEKLNKE